MATITEVLSAFGIEPGVTLGLARALGFATAVTTRPGMLFPEHADRLAALPRASVNGRWQSPEALEVLLSGAPFWLWNCGRRISA